jgi:hypothetical protein
MNGTADCGVGRGIAARRWLVAGVLAAGAAGAGAQPARLTLEDMTVQSDLVFRGVVEGIRYVMSEPSGQEQISVPFTFVTYRVGEVLRGENPGETVTLRFIGGFNEKTERLMTASHTPRIDVGDEDVMFVRGNDERQVPLVGNLDGRLRVVDGQVYTEMGRSVLFDETGGIEKGPQYRLDEVENFTVAGHVFKIKYEPGTREAPSDAVAVAALTERVRAIGKNAPEAGAFENADPTRPVPGPDVTPAPPPRAKPGEGQPDPVEAGEEAPAQVVPRR